MWFSHALGCSRCGSILVFCESIIECLAKGVKQKCLLGGNPTNLSFFFLFCVFHTFIILLWLCFLCFFFAFVPRKTVMISLGDDRLVMLEKTETFRSRKEFSFFSVRAFELILFAADFYANSSDFRNFSAFLKYQKYTKYTDCYRLVCC